MTTMITGAGLVGSLAAARVLTEQQERVVLYDVAFSMENLAERVPLERVTLVRGDLMDVPDLVRAIQTHGVDRIIHTAGLLTWMVRERPAAGVRINLLGTLDVLEASRLTGVKRVVFCSSGTVALGLKEPPPGGVLKEDFSLRSVSEYPPSVYASMKLAAEWLGHCYRNEYGVDFVAVRFAGVFGPWRGAPGGGPSRVMQQLIECAWHKKPCDINRGDLERAIEYTYAADAAQGAVRAAFASEPQSRVYPIGMGQLCSTREIIAIIDELLGRKVDLNVVEAGSFSGYGNKFYPSDASRSETELGFKLEFPMEAAISDYLRWMERWTTR